MAKICVVNIREEEKSRPFIAASYKALEKVKRGETQISIKSIRRGANTHSQMANPYGLFLTSGEIIETVLEAANEGYNAVVLNGTLDRYLGIQQARSIVNIPVISPSEATMLFACMLGQRFGMVVLGAPYLKPMMESIISQHGLQHRAIANPIKFMSITHDYLMTKVMEDPTLITNNVLEVAEECVKDGAEVIIVIGANLGVACTLAGIASVNINGLEVPVLNPLDIALKTAETMADLQLKVGLPPISRVGMNRLVSKEDLKGVRVAFGLETE